MKKKQKLELPTVDEPTTCCWCEHSIGEDGPLYGLFAESIYELSPKGRWVQIVLLSGKTITCGITGKRSKARKEGYDLMFEVCSDDCGRKLQTALSQDKDQFVTEFAAYITKLADPSLN